MLDDLAAAGVTIYDVGLRRPTLDDVFLTLTGHVADGEESANGNGNGDRPRDRRDRGHRCPHRAHGSRRDPGDED